VHTTFSHLCKARGGHGLDHAWVGLPHFV
jgi:hypothetical protein